MTADTRPSQDQASQHSDFCWRGDHGALPIADSYWKLKVSRDGQLVFFRDMVTRFVPAPEAGSVLCTCSVSSSLWAIKRKKRL